jgi:hypothetical protein
MRVRVRILTYAGVYTHTKSVYVSIRQCMRVRIRQHTSDSDTSGAGASFEALSRLYEGSIKALLRLY